MFANIFGMLAFFAAYFWVQDHAFFPPTPMPLTSIDRWVAYLPAAIVPYASLWLYVSLPLALMVERRDFRSFGLAAFAVAAGGLLTFMLLPTTLPADVEWSARSAASFLRGVDSVGNACPSLHVAFAVFSWVWLDRLLAAMAGGRPLKMANGLWCAAILYSTLAIRQHVLVDVLAGAAWGGGVAALNMAWLKRVATRARGLPVHHSLTDLDETGPAIVRIGDPAGAVEAAGGVGRPAGGERAPVTTA